VFPLEIKTDDSPYTLTLKAARWSLVTAITPQNFDFFTNANIKFGR